MGMKKVKWAVFIVAGIFLLAACSNQSAESSSPEAAVVAYLEGLRDGDFDCMLAVLPDEQAIAANREYFIALGTPPAGLTDENYSLEEIDGFIAYLNWLLEHFQSPLSPYDFQSLEVVGFIPEEYFGEIYLSERNQYVLSNQAQRWGADQLVSRVAIFELGGKRYMMFVDVANFGGEWRILMFGGNLSMLLGMSWQARGIIPPEFVDEFASEFLGVTDLETVLFLP